MKMKRSNTKRLAAATLSLLLAFSSAIPASAAGPLVTVGDGRTPTCDEAYYATLDYYGNLTEGSIVKSYVLNGATSITDYGEYDSIDNLTNSTVPTQSAKRVAFDFSGEASAPTHFYFQGKTAKPFQNLPWTLTISYKLNGVPTKAEDLGGKTGVVEINVDAIPNKNVNDYARHNYTLEAMALFNQDDILSLEAPGAQVQLLGNLRAVLFVAFPGEEGHFTIRVGADQFQFGGMTFLMVPATLSQLDEISKLAQRKEDLETNYERLSGSFDVLLDSLNAVSGSLYASANGLDALNATRDTLSSNKADVYAAADLALGDLDSIAAALVPVSSELSAAQGRITDAHTSLDEVMDTTDALRSDLDKLDTILETTQGSKDDVLLLLDDLVRLQSQLQSASGSLDHVFFPGINGITSPFAGQSTQSLRDSKQSVSQLIGYYHAANDVDLATFLAGALAGTQLAGCTSSAEAYDAAYLMAATFALNQINSQLPVGLDPVPMPGSAAEARATFEYLRTLPGLENTIAGAVASVEAKAREAQAQVAQLEGIYSAAQGSLEDFLRALVPADQLEDALQLAGLIEADEDATDFMIEEVDAVNEAIGDINGAVASINAALYSASSVSRTVGMLMDALADFCGEFEKLRPLILDADDMTALARENNANVKATLESLDALRELLDGYESEFTRTSGELQTASDKLAAASADANAFLHSAETLMQDTGVQLDEATQQSLASISSALRRTANALGSGNGVREAKETINDMVEETWSDYTGDINDLLEMDATAETVSLTDARNPSPASVQVLIRTQEIKADNAPAAEKLAAVQTVEEDNSTFFSRVADMFTEIWAAITGLFRR